MSALATLKTNLEAKGIDFDQFADDNPKVVMYLMGGLPLGSDLLSDISTYLEDENENITEAEITEVTDSAVDEANAQANAQYHQHVFSETPIIHQDDDTYHPYITLTANIPEDGDYMLDMYYNWSYNNNQTDFMAHVEYDGNFYFIQHMEPKDVGGSGTVEATSTGGTANTGTNQFMVCNAKRPFTLTAGTHTFVLEFKGERSNQEACIYEAYLGISKITN